jgi:hypothetical protein
MIGKHILVAFILLATVQAFTFLKTEPKLTPYDVKKSQEWAVFASVAYCPKTCL